MNFHTHWQNLNRDHKDRPRGSGFWHARRWWYIGSLTIGLEWAMGPFNRSLFASLGLGGYDDNTLYFHMGIPFLFGLYLNFKHRRFMRGYGNARELGIHWTRDFVHWNIWVDPDGPSYSNPPKGEPRRWRREGVFVNDLIRGRSKYSEETYREEDVLIPMPERSYKAHIRLFQATWTYPRWPWPQRILRAEVDIPDGIPVPGKGENSWDLGDDATYGFTGPCNSIPEAIAKVVQSALRDRERYGGLSWDATKAETYKPG